MLVDIDWVKTAKKRLALINACELEDIQWVQEGVDVSFSKEQLEEFGFSGLNNTDILGRYKPTKD
jgi:hypothetical protein